MFYLFILLLIIALYLSMQRHGVQAAEFVLHVIGGLFVVAIAMSLYYTYIA